MGARLADFAGPVRIASEPGPQHENEKERLDHVRTFYWQAARTEGAPSCQTRRRPQTGPRPEDVSDRPFTEPETEDGMGPTLGEDVSPEHERAEDARYRREQEHEGGGATAASTRPISMCCAAPAATEQPHNPSGGSAAPAQARAAHNPTIRLTCARGRFGGCVGPFGAASEDAVDLGRVRQVATHGPRPPASWPRPSPPPGAGLKRTEALAGITCQAPAPWSLPTARRRTPDQVVGLRRSARASSVSGRGSASVLARLILRVISSAVSVRLMRLWSDGSDLLIFELPSRRDIPPAPPAPGFSGSGRGKKPGVLRSRC